MVRSLVQKTALMPNPKTGEIGATAAVCHTGGCSQHATGLWNTDLRPIAKHALPRTVTYNDAGGRLTTGLAILR